MENVKVVFHILPNDEKALNGYQYVNCHMVFEEKIVRFQKMACLVVGYHVTQMLDGMTYSSIVT